MSGVRVAVVGIGYVGLPVACILAEQGFGTVGIDIDAERVAKVNRGECPIGGDEPGLAELLGSMVRKGRLHASTDASEIAGADAVFVCVDTPIDDDRVPRLRALRAAVSSIGDNLSQGALVSIESTIPPGTMDGVVIPTLEERSGMMAGRDFSVVHCPERVMPGRLLHNLRSYRRVLGGLDQRSLERGESYYTTYVEEGVITTSLISAEITKTAENAYRDVQIAFANEVALICERLGADAFEVRELVNSCPFRDMHVPGSGVGGHCLPKDPWLLVSNVRDSARLIPTAREVNDSMPLHLLELAKEGMEGKGVDPSSARVAVMGLAFLHDSDDVRNSPAKEIIDSLEGDVIVHDPFVERPYRAPLTRDAWEALEGADCAIFVTEHSEYHGMGADDIVRRMRTPVVIDGRNIFDRLPLEAAGARYLGIGKRH